MAYQTGVIGSAENMRSVLQGFAITQGWTVLPDGDTLQKGDSYIQVTCPDANELRIRGAKSNDWTAPNICARFSRIRLTTWPVNGVYHLFGLDNPDFIWLTLNYDNIRHMHLGFGKIFKYGDWVGGTFFHASHIGNGISPNQDGVVSEVIGGGQKPYYSGSAKSTGLFWSSNDGSNWDARADIFNKPSHLHCEAGGEIWAGTQFSIEDRNRIHNPTVQAPLQHIAVNAFNSQTNLTPFQLYLQNTDGYMRPIGHVEHIRFLKMLNYNPGDVLEIGPERWKVFPMYTYDTTYPDGRQVDYNNGAYSTGILGYAIRLEE